MPHIRTPIRTGKSVRVRAVAPKLGQHNAEIFGHLGVSEAEIEQLHAPGRSVNPGGLGARRVGTAVPLDG